MEEDVEEEHDGTVRQLLLKIGDELNRCWTIQLELFKCLDEKLTKLPDRIVSSLQDILIDMHHGTGIKKEDTYIISDALRKPAKTQKKAYVTKYGRRTSVSCGYS
ncbi:unnamed protein product [Auanema sp. JU1783]|nr:unnamed protein product [Auanema sp. JU1783]